MSDTPNLPLITVLEHYWATLRDAHPVPRRSDVDPSSFDAVLPYSFIVEWVAPQVTRLRVCGQKVNKLIGMEGIGLPLSVIMSPSDKDEFSRSVDLCFDTPAIIKIPVVSRLTGLRPKELRGMIALFPLSGPTGTVDRALGGVFVDGPRGETPREFRVDTDRDIVVEEVNGLARNEKGPTKSGPTLRLIIDNDRKD